MRRLAVLLGLLPTAMNSWPESRMPRRVMINGAPHFAHDDVNEWLATPGKMHGFAEPLTIERLIRGECQLVRLKLVRDSIVGNRKMKDYGQYVKFKIRAGVLPAVNVGTGQWVLSVAGVKRFCEVRDAKIASSYSNTDLKHLIGATPHLIKTAVDCGQLTTIMLEGHPRVTHESLVAHLPSLLSDNVSPEEWLELRKASERPLVRARQAAPEVGLSYAMLIAKLSSDVFQSVMSLGAGQFLISPESIDLYKTLTTPLTTHEMAMVFGVTVTTVRTWRAGDLLVCPLPEHGSSCDMFLWCLTAFLQRDCGPTTKATKWVSYCLKRGVKAVHEPRALNVVGLGIGDFRRIVEERSIEYICTPTGVRVYRESDIRKIN